MKNWKYEKALLEYKYDKFMIKLTLTVEMYLMLAGVTVFAIVYISCISCIWSVN
jgi:hypothetical protein